MGVEWDDRGFRSELSAEAVTLNVYEALNGDGWVWRLHRSGASCGDGGCESRDAAKLAALNFARDWLRRQAEALGDGWVPVEERLPDAGYDVLVVAKEPDGFTYRGLACWDSERWVINGVRFHDLIVSHWRELPPLPEVKG